MAETKTKDKKKKGQEADPDLQRPTEVTPAPLETGGDFVSHMVAKYGSEKEAVARLGAENVAYRDRHRKDTEQIERLQDRIEDTPEIEEGGRVITKVEATEYDELKKFGKVEEVKKKIDEGATAQAKLTEREARDNIASVAAIVNEGNGWNVEALTELAAKYDLTLTIEKKKVDGELKEVAMVTPKGDTKSYELESYVDDKLSLFKPALEAVAADDDEDGDKKEVTRTVKQDRGQATSLSRKNDTKATVSGLTAKRYQLPSERNKASSDKK